MKASEAKEKVCPFIQSSEMVAVSQERNAVAAEFNYPANINCICGDCMAWQFVDVYSDTFETIEETDEGYCKRIGQ